MCAPSASYLLEGSQAHWMRLPPRRAYWAVRVPAKKADCRSIALDKGCVPSRSSSELEARRDQHKARHRRFPLFFNALPNAFHLQVQSDGTHVGRGSSRESGTHATAPPTGRNLAPVHRTIIRGRWLAPEDSGSPRPGGWHHR